MPGPLQFTPKIDLGHILTAVCLIATLCITWAQFDARIQSIEKTMLEVQHSVFAVSAQVNDIRVNQVRDTTRLDDLMKK